MALSVLLARASLMVVLGLACRAGYAQADSVAAYLKRMDQSRDGRVSQDEYIAWMSYGFDSMDRNRDGVLQTAEQPGGHGKAFTRAEHHANLIERFGKQDADRNGFLSASELAAPPR